MPVEVVQRAKAKCFRLLRHYSLHNPARESFSTRRFPRGGRAWSAESLLGWTALRFRFGALFRGSLFVFQAGQVFDHDLSSFHIEEAFSLQPAQIARNQLANGPLLGSQILMALGQFHANPFLRRYSARLRQPQDQSDEPLPDSRER